VAFLLPHIIAQCILTWSQLLTVTATNNTKPEDKPYKLADEKGLSLFIQSSGTKLWTFDYRFGGKRKTLALGAFPEVTLSDARDRTDAARKLLANDANPCQTKKAVKASKIGLELNSMEVVARDWASSYFTNKSASHQQRTMRRLGNPPP